MSVDVHVRERDETVDIPLVTEEFEAERRTVNRMVDGPIPQPRQEGDVWVVPLLEEVLVVEKRLILREEVRLVKKRTTRRDPRRVTLRREEAEIRREAPRGHPNPQAEGA